MQQFIQYHNIMFTHILKACGCVDHYSISSRTLCWNANNCVFHLDELINLDYQSDQNDIILINVQVLSIIVHYICDKIGSTINSIMITLSWGGGGAAALPLESHSPVT